MTFTRRALVVAGSVLALAGGGIGTAQASHLGLDLPLTVEVCRLDTSPSFPSCGIVVEGSVRAECSSSTAPFRFVATCDVAIEDVQ